MWGQRRLKRGDFFEIPRTSFYMDGIPFDCMQWRASALIFSRHVVKCIPTCTLRYGCVYNYNHACFQYCARTRAWGQPFWLPLHLISLSIVCGVVTNDNSESIVDVSPNIHIISRESVFYRNQNSKSSFLDHLMYFAYQQYPSWHNLWAGF